MLCLALWGKGEGDLDQRQCASPRLSRASILS
jgi:hypothetical protein